MLIISNGNDFRWLWFPMVMISDGYDFRWLWFPMVIISDGYHFRWLWFTMVMIYDGYDHGLVFCFLDSVLQVMWSSCPQNYIWSMRCSDWSTSSIRCPIGSVMLGLYVRQTGLDDLPMDDIVRDLCPTGIKFGASDFKWFYSFGENSKYNLKPNRCTLCSNLLDNAALFWSDRLYNRHFPTTFLHTSLDRHTTRPFCKIQLEWSARNVKGLLLFEKRYAVNIKLFDNVTSLISMFLDSSLY